MKTDSTETKVVPGADSSPSPCSADFARWSTARGVWPRLTHDEIFRAGWESCATRLREVCTSPHESKGDFIERIKAIISLPNDGLEPSARSNADGSEKE